MLQNNELKGYLMKYCGKGPLGGFKKRWFCFNESNNKLEYFKSNTDKNPLDYLDLKNASFTISCQDESQSFIENTVKNNFSDLTCTKLTQSCCFFKIISGDKILFLKANTPHECIAWIQKLQSIRKSLNEDEIRDNKYQKRKNLNKTFCKSNNDLNNVLPDQKIKSSSFDYDLNFPSNSTQIADKEITSLLYDPNENTSQQLKNKVFLNLFAKLRKDRTKKDDFETRNNCPNCFKLEDQVITLKDDLSAVENEVYGHKEIIKVLQNQIEHLITEKDTYEKLCKNFINGNDENFNNLVENEKELAFCKLKVEEQKKKLEDYLNENQSLKKELNELNENIAVLNEILLVKGKTVISLTDEIFDLENGSNNSNSKVPTLNFDNDINENINESNKINAFKFENTENEKLKDTLQAFQSQNYYLNKEIVELNEFKKIYELKKKKLEMQCQEWEAKCCQVQSKLLSLLKEIRCNIDENCQNLDSNDDINEIKSKLISQNDSVKCLVQRLLNENSLDIPLSWRSGNLKHKIRSKSENSESLKQLSKSCNNKTIIEFDELGFQKKISQDNVFDDHFENLTLNSDFFQNCSNNSSKEDLKQNLNNSTENNEIDCIKDVKQWRFQWDSYVSLISNNESLNRCLILKNLLRSGIPQEYRPKIWKMCINMLVDNEKSSYEPDYYNNLVKASQTKNLNSSCKQIELDLLRTLPNNRNFESRQCDGISRLRRVLTAYSQRNHTVGYCQGMNRLAAVALLFLSEEDAFWCLVAIIEMIMPKNYYTLTLFGAHVDQYVLKDLILEKLPDLYAHFENYNIEISLFSWFLTCFVDNIPPDIYLRIWDVFLYEGSKVLFRFALAFLKYHEINLLSLKDSVSINQYLRIFGEKTYDVRQLTFIAFNTLNPFPMSKIKSKRVFYKNVVSSELEKSETISRTSIDSGQTLDTQSD